SRGTFLDGGEHGGARGIVRTAAGNQVPHAHQGGARNGAAPESHIRTGIGRSRARALVLQSARMVRRQSQAGRTAPARIAQVQPEQHRLALLSRRTVRGRWTEERGARRAAESTRRAVRSGVGSGGSGVQGEGEAAAGDAALAASVLIKPLT